MTKKLTAVLILLSLACFAQGNVSNKVVNDAGM
jgi:hypothetical protein